MPIPSGLGKEPEMVVCAYNPSPQRLRQEDDKYEASLSYIGKPCLQRAKAKKKKI
jgi:hypothetical protein